MGVEEGGFEPEAVVGVGAAEYGVAAGEEGAADGGDGGVGGVGGAEEDGADGGVVVEVEGGGFVDEVGEVVGGGEGAVDEVGESGAAECLEGDGDFEGVGAAGGAEGAAEEVGEAGFGVVVGVEVGGLVVEWGEVVAVGDGEDACGCGLPAEFVEVEGDAVGAVEAVDLVAVGGAEEEGPAVGGVDVEFRAVGGAEVGDGGEWVDLAGVGGAGGGGDEEGLVAVVGEGLVECGEVHDAVGGGDGEGVGRPRSQAARVMLWWALVAQMVCTGPLRSRARRRASWLDSVPPVVMSASGVGWWG